jgi:hypothetical protein
MYSLTRISRTGFAVVLSLGLVGGAAVVAGSASAGPAPTVAIHHAKPAAAAAAQRGRHGTNRCKRNRIDVPKCGVLWGMYTSPRPFTPSWHSPYRPFEKATGRRFDIVKQYAQWKPGVFFPSGADERLAGHGQRTLDVSWNATTFGAGRHQISYASIAAGTWDASVIRPEARRLKAFHHKIFVDFDHEFDSKAQAGKGSPAQYVAAYRHIHQVMAAMGVNNVIWTWVSTGDVDHASMLRASYPGAKYVDWIGYDPYNWYGCRADFPHTASRSPRAVFGAYYHWVRHQHGMKHKPLMLAEYASAQGPAQGPWYAHVARALRHLRRIKAVLQFDAQGVPGCNFRLADSPAALRGFAKSGRSNYVTGRHHHHHNKHHHNKHHHH